MNLLRGDVLSKSALSDDNSPYFLNDDDSRAVR